MIKPVEWEVEHELLSSHEVTGTKVVCCVEWFGDNEVGVETGVLEVSVVGFDEVVSDVPWLFGVDVVPVTGVSGTDVVPVTGVPEVEVVLDDPVELLTSVVPDEVSVEVNGQ